MDLATVFFKNQLVIENLARFRNLLIRGVPVDHKAAVQQIHDQVLANNLAKSENASQRLMVAAQTAEHRATRAGKPHLQDKLAQVEIKVAEIQQILADPDIQALMGASQLCRCHLENTPLR